MRDAAMFKLTPSLERQQWLEAAVEALRDRFARAGYTIPEEVRYSIGWPKRASSCGAIGECWPADASSDRHREMFVSPVCVDGLEVIATQAHELAHVACGVPGHGPAFKRCALAIGLTGRMRATVPGPEFTVWAYALFKHIGLYPAGFLTDTPKQGTRMLKCACRACGYTIRITRKWLDASGPPICPTDRISLTEEGKELK
jgi:hypothetical protein